MFAQIKDVFDSYKKLDLSKLDTQKKLIMISELSTMLIFLSGNLKTIRDDIKTLQVKFEIEFDLLKQINEMIETIKNDPDISLYFEKKI